MPIDVSEYPAKLKKQGYKLCISLRKSQMEALWRFGFQADQDVVLRFRREKLEILPRVSTEVARDRMLAAAVELRDVRGRMQEIADAFSGVTDEELERGETPEAELLGLVECLLADDLDSAIEKLESVVALAPAAREKGSQSKLRGRDGTSPAGSR